MAITFGNWIVAIVVALIVLIVGLVYAISEESIRASIISIVLALVALFIILVICNWYNTSTASGQRNYKDFISEFNGGLKREITITAEDGREIFHYEGKVDIETKHEGNANYILFESEEGHRYIIYYGITDTVLIIEKD